MDDKTNDLGQAVTPDLEPARDGSVGPIIGTIIILAVIVLGGLYFWGQRAEQRAMTAEELQATVEDIQSQSTSDAPADIQADLNATDIDNIDAELQGI